MTEPRDHANLWRRIASCYETEFQTKNGVRFSYTVRDDLLHLHNTNQTLPRTYFEDAASRGGVLKPSDLKDLRGYSYIWAVLRDPRIGGLST